MFYEIFHLKYITGQSLSASIDVADLSHSQPSNTGLFFVVNGFRSVSELSHRSSFALWTINDFPCPGNGAKSIYPGSSQHQTWSVNWTDFRMDREHSALLTSSWLQTLDNVRILRDALHLQLIMKEYDIKFTSWT